MSAGLGIMALMFDGLFEVDWASMSHAYGSAQEVPGLLLALRSADEAEREKALSQFYGTVPASRTTRSCSAAAAPSSPASADPRAVVTR